MPISIYGEYEVEHLREGKSIDLICGRNNITYDGLSHLLNSAFLADNSLRTTVWYICLFEDMVNRVTGEVTPTTVNYGDTLNVHSFVQFTGISTEYSPVWDPLPTFLTDTTLYKQNSPIQITITDSNVTPLGGMFICNDGNLPVVSDGSDTRVTNHILWATIQFRSPMKVTAGDVLSVQYKLKVGIV